MMSGNNPAHRRTVLKAIGGIGTIATTTGVVSAKKPTRVGIVTGSFKNPVTATERANLRSKIRSAATPRTANGVTFHTKTTTESDPVVAYIYGLDTNGVPFEHSVTAHNRNEVERGVREAKSLVENFRTQTDNISTMGDVVQDPWNKTADMIHSYYDSAGDLRVHARFYHLESGNQNRDIFAIRQELEIMPDAGDFVSDEFVQDWSHGNAEAVGDVSPENPVDGGGSFLSELSSEYDGAVIGWSYWLADTQSIEPTHTQYDIQNGIASWEFADDDGTHDHIIDPGSVAVFNEVTDGEEVLDLTSKVSFYYPNDPLLATVGGNDIIEANKVNE